MGKIDYREIENLQGKVSSHYNSISEATVEERSSPLHRLLVKRWNFR